MSVKSSEAPLIEVRPRRLAGMNCRRIVDGVRLVNGTLMLDADPGSAGAISTVLVKKGVRVSELRPGEFLATL